MASIRRYKNMITACFCCLIPLSHFLSWASHWDSSSDNKKSSSYVASKPSDLIFLLTQSFFLFLARAALFFSLFFSRDTFPQRLSQWIGKWSGQPRILSSKTSFFFFSRRPSSAHNIANNCLYSVSLSSHSLRVSVCLMSWFGCPLKRSFQSGYFGPHFDSLAVCLHPVVYHPLQELPLCVCVCVCTVFLFCAHVFFLHSTINCLCYTLYIVSIRKIGLFSLETEVNHKEEPLAASQHNNQPPVSWCFSAPLITLKRTVYCRELLSLLMERRGAYIQCAHFFLMKSVNFNHRRSCSMQARS